MKITQWIPNAQHDRGLVEFGRYVYDIFGPCYRVTREANGEITARSAGDLEIFRGSTIETWDWIATLTGGSK